MLALEPPADISPCCPSLYPLKVGSLRENRCDSVTWDDWGGFYDHVKPKVTTAKDGRQFSNGFRLPLIVISPYAKKGAILKHRTEQASVPKLIERLWGMTLMSTRNAHSRDGIAGSLYEAFDFSQAPRAPMILPRGSCPAN